MFFGTTDSRLTAIFKLNSLTFSASTSRVIVFLGRAADSISMASMTAPVAPLIINPYTQRLLSCAGIFSYNTNWAF
ncbi:MAG: hypothetical protein KA343_04955 [Nitrosomonas sp.]|nr:hypothetical protein [Nitrosomonas sp.]